MPAKKKSKRGGPGTKRGGPGTKRGGPGTKRSGPAKKKKKKTTKKRGGPGTKRGGPGTKRGGPKKKKKKKTTKKRGGPGTKRGGPKKKKKATRKRGGPGTKRGGPAKKKKKRGAKKKKKKKAASKKKKKKVKAKKKRKASNRKKAKTTMKQGMSLHIGINYLNEPDYPCEPPGDYPDGWDGRLDSCENDAIALEEMASKLKFRTRKLLTKEATAENVSKELTKAAKTLKSGDLFLLTYAGHGGQVPDRSRDEKDDSLDETWCLHNRQFLDDELYAHFAEFKPGVRILILSDSCHSGTVSRSGPRSGPLRSGKKASRARCMPPDSVAPLYRARKDLYDGLQAKPKVQEGDVKASIRLLAACQDYQEASCDAFMGYFTNAVLRVWDDGAFEGNYDDFFDAVTKRLDQVTGDSQTRAAGGEAVDETALQTPNHFHEGVRDPDFDRQRPFTI